MILDDVQDPDVSFGGNVFPMFDKRASVCCKFFVTVHLHRTCMLG